MRQRGEIVVKPEADDGLASVRYRTEGGTTPLGKAVRSRRRAVRTDPTKAASSD